MKELDQYFKAVNKQLSVFSWKRRRAAMEELRGDVQSYLSEHPNAGIHDVVDCFGSPDEIAASFLEGENPDAFKKQRDAKKRMMIIICITTVILAIILVLLSLFRVIDYYDFSHGYIVVTGGISGSPPPDTSAIAVY